MATRARIKHGLLAHDTVLPGEDPAEFDRQLAALKADLQPANSLEFELVRQIADAQRRMRRLTGKYRPDTLRPGYDAWGRFNQK